MVPIINFSISECTKIELMVEMKALLPSTAVLLLLPPLRVIIPHPQAASPPVAFSAVLAPSSPMKCMKTTDIGDFHCIYGQANDNLLKETAKPVKM